MRVYGEFPLSYNGLAFCDKVHACRWEESDPSAGIDGHQTGVYYEIAK